jgi:hypothetical protein
VAVGRLASQRRAEVPLERSHPVSASAVALERAVPSPGPPSRDSRATPSVQWLPMIRRLFTVLSALSLLLCVAVVVLWVRSYRVNETVAWYVNEWDGWDGRFRARGASSDSGGVMFFILRREAHLELEPDAHLRASFKRGNPDLHRPGYRTDPPAGYPYMGGHYKGWGRFGFGFYAGDRTPPSWPMSHDDLFLVVPHWLLVLAAALLPARWALARRRQRRSRRSALGLCPRCGYDLRATPGRCPECGSAMGKGQRWATNL